MPEIPENNYNTLVQAPRNLFVLGQISCNEGGRGSISCAVTAANGEVRKIQVSAHYYRLSDSQIQFNALTMPVLAGEQFKVNATETYKSIVTKFWTVDWA